MISKEKLEGYMLNLSLSYEEQSDNLYVIYGRERGLENVVVMLDDPIVVIRVKVMDLPEANKEKFCEELLRLNASDLIHGAYALEGNSVILIDTLVGATMDLEEFQGSLDAIGMALIEHYKKLAKYRKKG